MKPGLRKPPSVLRHRSRGQSIVLIALILAILIGLVALSVDVGSTYAQQRATQRASDAAAMDGMTAMLNGFSCSVINEQIKKSLASHGIDAVESTDDTVKVNPGQRKLVANFIVGGANPNDDGGIPIPVSSCGEGSPPANAQYIKVSLDGIESTNFASLFGRNDLPVNANAYAKRVICPPVPIALSMDAFKKPGQIGSTYTDSDYKHGRPERRFFLRTDSSEGTGGTPITSPPGDFVWLSWTENNSDSNVSLAQALTPPGTTNQGFEEAPWSDSFPDAKPEKYPNQPGLPNEYDAMYGARTMKLGQGYSQGGPNGNNGPGGDAAVAKQMKWLVDNKVKINMPRWSSTNGSIGDKGTYLIKGFSSNMIVGYGYMADGDPKLPGWGQGWYLDLVDLGAPQECPQSENAPVQTDPITLKGSVAIRPRYGDGVSGRKPQDVVIVLDASGSMNWTWKGVGSYTSDSQSSLGQYTKSGNDLDCVALLAKYKETIGCQSTEAYKDYKQRRLYQAKQVIRDFLTSFGWNTNDRVAVVTYNGDKDTEGGDTHFLPAGGLQKLDDLSGNTFADQMINEAASKFQNDPDKGKLYTTVGASPGAQGLKLAKQLLDGAPNDMDRSRSVIFLTDGLLNVFDNGTRNSPETIEANYDKTDVKALPINQAIARAHAITAKTNPKNALLYVIALGSTFDKSGLPNMASSPESPYFATVKDKESLEQVFKDIKKDISDAKCKPMFETQNPVVPSADRTFRWDQTTNSWLSEMANGQPSLGVVTVKQGNSILKQAVIRTDGTFEVPGLEPNTSYTLTFNNPGDHQPVFYEGVDQPPPGIKRNYNTVEETQSPDKTVTIGDVNLGKVQYVYPNDADKPVVLTTTVDVCPPDSSGG